MSASSPKRFKHRQAELEINVFTAVSFGEDNGAYVQASRFRM